MSDSFSPAPPASRPLEATWKRRRCPSGGEVQVVPLAPPAEDGPECCGHRDVLPMAGTSFNPEAWCPDCAFFKLRRTPKKRSAEDYRY